MFLLEWCYQLNLNPKWSSRRTNWNICLYCIMGSLHSQAVEGILLDYSSIHLRLILLCFWIEGKFKVSIEVSFFILKHSFWLMVVRFFYFSSFSRSFPPLHFCSCYIFEFGYHLKTHSLYLLSTKRIWMVHFDGVHCIKKEWRKNSTHHFCSKYIDIQHYFICDKVESDVIQMKYDPIECMILDVLTKALGELPWRSLKKDGSNNVWQQSESDGKS